MTEIKRTLTKKEEEMLINGSFLVKDTMIYTGSWNKEIAEYNIKNVRFFEMLVEGTYDELIYVDEEDNKHIYFDLIVIKKGGEDLVLPAPLVYDSLFYGGAYESYEEFINDSGLIWFIDPGKGEVDENTEYRAFDKTVSREEYYASRKSKRNKKIMGTLKDLIDGEVIEWENKTSKVKIRYIASFGDIIFNEYVKELDIDIEETIEFEEMMELLDF